MNRKIALVGALVLVVAMFGCSKTGSDGSKLPDMSEGNWKVATTMQVPGMDPQTITHEQCIKKGEMIPKGNNMEGCEKVEEKISGNTATWVYKCKMPNGEMTSRGSVTYAGETMTGLVHIDMGGKKMTTRMQGKRIGDCS